MSVASTARAMVVATTVGVVAGALLGALGVAVENRNERLHGASFSSYQFEILSLPALPGTLITQQRIAHDLRLGELRHHTGAVVFWNAVVFGAVGLVIGYIVPPDRGGGGDGVDQLEPKN